MTDEELASVVRSRFHAGMSVDEADAAIGKAGFQTKTLGTDYSFPDYVFSQPLVECATGDLLIGLRPKGVLGDGGFALMYSVEPLLFRFGGDEILDDVVRRPFGSVRHNDSLIISLHPESKQ